MMEESEMEPEHNKPRLRDIESQPLTTEEKESFRQKMRERTLMSRIAQGVAIASAVFAILSIVRFGETINYVAGIIAVAVAPVVFYYQLELEKEDSKSRFSCS